jgi:hypothetical protein
MRVRRSIGLGLVSGVALYCTFDRSGDVAPRIGTSVAQDTAPEQQAPVTSVSAKRAAAAARPHSTTHAASLRSERAAPAAAAAPDPEKLWDPGDEGEEGDARDRELLLGLFELFEVPEDKLLELRCQVSTCRDR